MVLLREYHAVIGTIIDKHGGTLERFAGDGVMVIFNDPVPLPNPALVAVQMALEIRAALGVLMEKWRRLGHELGFASVFRTAMRRSALFDSRAASTIPRSAR